MSNKIKGSVIMFLFLMGLGAVIFAVQSRVTSPASFVLPGKIVFDSDRVTGRELFILENGEIIHLVKGREPSFAFGAKKLLFTNKGYELAIYDLESKDEFKLTQNTEFPFSDPKISPKNDRLVWTMGQDQKDILENLYVSDVYGKNVKQLTFFTDESVRRPRWFPDGGSIIFEKKFLGKETRSEIWTINVDGSNLKKIGENSRRRDFDPCYSPDGTKIAFASMRDKDQFSQIYIMDLEGNVIKKVTDNRWANSFPVWSPNRKWIAYVSFQHRGIMSESEIYAMNLETGKEVQATPPAKVPGMDRYVTDLFPDWAE